MLIDCGSSATDGFSVSFPNYVIFRNNYFFNVKTWPAEELARNKQAQSNLSVIYEVPKSTTPRSSGEEYTWQSLEKSLKLC